MAQRSATGNAGGIAIHDAKAVGHDIEKVADGDLAQPLLVITWRLLKPPLDDHAVTRARLVVAGGAENVEALPAAF